MKKLVSFGAPVTVALILGLAVYAMPAMGTSNSLPSRIAKLEATTKKLAAANAKLTVANTKLAKRVTSLELFIDCNTKVAPVSIKGDPATNSGFEYTPDNKVTVTLFKGLVPTPAGETPDEFLQLVDADCVSGRAQKAPRHAATHRSH